MSYYSAFMRDRPKPVERVRYPGGPVEVDYFLSFGIGERRAQWDLEFYDQIKEWSYIIQKVLIEQS